MLKKIIKKTLPRPIINLCRGFLGLVVFESRKFFSKKLPEKHLHLHLGCGEVRMDGFINVDFLKTSATDVIEDVTKLESFEDNSVSLIYACQILEHFSHDEVPQILRRWFEVLAPGGVIRISVPDLDRIVQIYLKNWDHFHRDNNAPWIGLIYGGQKDQYDFHKTGFNAFWLGKLLSDAGFSNMQEYPHSPHFFRENFVDGSTLTEPFGEFFTLNMMAMKPIEQ